MRRFHGQRSVKRTIFLPSSATKVFYRGGAKNWSPGLVNFVPAVAFHFCLNLPENLNLKNSCNPGLFSPSQYLILFQSMCLCGKPPLGSCISCLHFSIWLIHETSQTITPNIPINPVTGATSFTAGYAASDPFRSISEPA